MGLVATGAGSVALFGLEKRSPQSPTGIPLVLASAVAAPSAPTTTGPAGSGVTGTVQHRIRGVVLGRGRTAASAASTALTVSNKTCAVSWSALGSGTGCIGYQVERASLTLAEATTGVTGLEDATFAGTFAGEPGDYWEVEITGNGTPDVFRWRKNGGSWTTGVNITGSGQTLSSGVTVTFAATVGHTIGDVWTYTVSGTWKFLANVWGRTTVAYSDSTAVGSEPTGYTVPTSDETAANGGLTSLDTEAGKIYARNDSRIVSKELSASLGQAQSIPGQISYDVEIPADLTIGKLAPVLATFSGKPTSSVVASTGIQQLTFSPTDDEASRVSAWGVYLKGGGISAIPPYLFMGAVYNDIAIDGLGGNGLAALKAKGMASGDSEFGYGLAYTGNSGTCAYLPVLKGTLREDLDATITELWSVVTEAPTPIGATGYGTVKWEVRTTRTGSSTEITMYYRTSDGSPVVYGANDDVFVEALDSSGYPYGPDASNNLREPLSLGIGNVTDLALGDAFQHYRPVPRPGAGSLGTYSGQLVRWETEGRFGAAAVTFYRGAVTADTWLRANVLGLKLTRSLSAAYYTGASARRPGAMRTVGPMTVEVTVDADFDSREMERYMKWNKTLVAQLSIVGGRIPTNPSVYSAYREGLVLDLYRCELAKIENAVSGEGPVAQKLTLAATRLDDPNAAPWQMVTTSPRTWDFSLAATAV